MQGRQGTQARRQAGKHAKHNWLAGWLAGGRALTTACSSTRAGDVWHREGAAAGTGLDWTGVHWSGRDRAGLGWGWVAAPGGISNSERRSGADALGQLRFSDLGRFQLSLFFWDSSGMVSERRRCVHEEVSDVVVRQHSLFSVPFAHVP
jgi:hypothetical protein